MPTFAYYQLMGIGGVIRDNVGDFLADFSVCTPLLLDAHCAQAFATSRAMQLAFETGFRDIQIEGDCLIVIKGLENGVVAFTHILILFSKMLGNTQSYAANGKYRLCVEKGIVLPTVQQNILQISMTILLGWKKLLIFLSPLLRSNVV